MGLVHDEQTKLSAMALNGVAIASIAAGFITPLAAVTFGLSGSAARGSGLTTLFACAWLIGGVVLHLLARQVLKGLRE